MSLIRRLQALLVAVLWLALGAALAGFLWSTRNLLHGELALRNRELAQSLALVLSQQRGDMALIDPLLAAQFDRGRYRRLQLRRLDAGPGFERRADVLPQHAPAWFVRLLPIAVPPGVASVSDGGRDIGMLEVEAPPAPAHDALWRGAVRTTTWLVVVAAAGLLLVVLVVARIRAPLRALAAQARAMVDGRHEPVALPAVAELRPLAEALNAGVQRTRSLFELQLSQLDQLRALAHLDPLTGVDQRAVFLDRLAALLQREDGLAGGSLLLVRLVDLVGINRTLGREAGDRALRIVAKLLQAYPEQVRDCLLGRLNGGDFALCLPKPGLAAETTASLAAALGAGLPAIGRGVRACVGAVEFGHGHAVASLLASADYALARAENRGAGGVEVLSLDATVPADGERHWHARVAAALDGRCLQLGSFPVVDIDGNVLHLECPLRLQLQPGGAFEVAAQWLPLAQRCRLTSQADQLALTLALDAIAADGVPRAVNVAPASLADAGFATRVQQCLLERPAQAAALWIELPEAAAIDQFELLQRFARLLQPLGTRVGLEHAGPLLHRIERLFELGIGFVKLDASMCAGVAASDTAREVVRATVALLHALAMQVLAEGVADELDARVLFDCGVDAVGGPSVVGRPA